MPKRWAPANIHSLTVQLPGGGSYSGSLEVSVLVDENGDLAMGPNGAIITAAEPANRNGDSFPLEDKPGLVKEISEAFSRREKELRAEKDLLLQELEKKDRRLEELERLNTGLQNLLTDSFRTLVERVAREKP